MPFIGSVSGSRSGRLFPLGGKPAKVGALTLTAGDADDTFTWSAPNTNGLPITKYGYQTTTNNGTSWNAEVEVSTTSAILNTQYSTSSFKLRVRAFNAAGWGEYSDISTGATVAWYKGNDNTDSYISQTVYDYQDCTSVGCGDCGTQARRKTRSKEQRKYRFIRSGSTSGPYDANWSDYTVYPEWSTISCADNGSCSEGTGTWSTTPNVTTSATDMIDGYSYTAFTQYTSPYTVYVYRNSTPQGCQDYGCGPPFTGSICSCWDYLAYNLEVCSTTGKKRAVEVGCVRFRDTNCGGAGS